MTDTIEHPKRGRGRPRKIVTHHASNTASVAVIRERIEATNPAGKVWLVSPKRAAELIGVSERTIHSLIATKELHSVLIGGSRRVFESDLMALCVRGVEQIGGAK
jgi:excisionase family DNA binding protein